MTNPDRIKKKVGDRPLLSRINLAICLVLLLMVLVNRFWILPGIDSQVFRGVPNFYTWITLWNCHTLETMDFTHYWTGNAMYPYPNSLAFSENMMGLTPFSAPIWLLSGNPILTANLLSILLLWLTAIMTFFVVRNMIGDTLPAILAAMIFSLYPWTLKAFSLGRLHMLALMWIPVVMFANWKFWETHLKRYLFILTFFWWWTFLMNIYLGIFMGVFLGIWNLSWFFYQKQSFSLKKIIQWLVAVFCVWLLMVPFFLRYQKVAKSMGMARTLQNQVQYTGPVWSWFTVSDENWLWGRTLKFLPTGQRDGIVENYMFPGFLVMGFFLISFFARNLPRWLKSLRLTGLIMFLLAMGPFALGIPGKIPLPFTLLWYLYPPLQATRNPHRLSLFVVLIMAVLAAYLVGSFLKNRRKKVLPVGFICRGIFWGKIGLVKPGPALFRNAREFYEPLKNSRQIHTLIELPVNIHTDLRAMVSSAFHWNRLVNGVSGLWPPLQNQLEGELREFPSPHTVGLLQSLEVDRIVIHETGYGKRRRRLLKQVRMFPEIKFISRTGSVSLWSLEKGKKRQVFNGKKDLVLSSPSTWVPGETFVSLDVAPAENSVVFNPQAPSKFSFTPSRLWEIACGFGERLAGETRINWRAPALIHAFNRGKKIRLLALPGHQLVNILVDMMGEDVRISEPVGFISMQPLPAGASPYLKLPAGYKAIPREALRVDFTVRLLDEAKIGKTGDVYGRITVENPGPYYWSCGLREGIFLGLKLVAGNREKTFEYELPHDLFPGDRAECPIRIFLSREFRGGSLLINCLEKTRETTRWGPRENEIKIR
jgi:hypothetical protein